MLRLTKGWGNLDTDHFNILLAIGHDEQAKLSATQRPFSATGAYFPFSYGGQNYFVNGRTSNTEPANLTFRAMPLRLHPQQRLPLCYALNPYYTQTWKLRQLCLPRR